MHPKNRAIISMICSIILAIFSYFHDNAGIGPGFYTFVIFSVLFLFMSILFKHIDIRAANILFYVLVIICLVFCITFLISK